MKRRVTLGSSILLAFAATGFACGQNSPAEQPQLSKEQIQQLFVRVSTAAYEGECPCPESVNSRGTLCGGNSAYRRGGGNRPLCYPTDVTDAMVQRYRDSLGKQ